MPLTYDPAQVPPREDRPAPPPVATAGQARPGTPPASRPARKVEDDRERPDKAAVNASCLWSRTTRPFAGILRDLAHEAGFQCLVAGYGRGSPGAGPPASAQRHRPRRRPARPVGPGRAGPAQARRRHPPHPGPRRLGRRPHPDRALSLGAVGYLVKPVKREDLSECAGGPDLAPVSLVTPRADRRGRPGPARRSRQAAGLGRRRDGRRAPPPPSAWSA